MAFPQVTAGEWRRLFASSHGPRGPILAKGDSLIMSTQDYLVSIILPAPVKKAYPTSDFKETVASALAIDHDKKEVIVVENEGQSESVSLGKKVEGQVKRVKGKFATRAAQLNAGIKAAKGDFVLLTPSDSTAVLFKKSSLTVYLYAATREGEQAGWLYADYERIVDGKVSEIHPLEWQQGRLRDLLDFGPVYFVSMKALKAIKGLDAKLKAGEMYDLRLKVSEKFPVKHISNRMGGSLYSVKKSGAGHNVFDYLLASKETQLEMERICTDHLKRTDAYLAPGAHYQEVKYTPKEKARFKECVASIVSPCYRRPEFIGPAIESVWAQTVQNIEMIIVVNGGESDPTIPAVKRYMKGGEKYDAKKPPVRLIVVDVNNLGLCLNYGCEQAKGKYYIQLDSDDQLEPNAVEEIVKVFDEDPKIGMVIGSYAVWELKADGKLVRNESVPVVTHAEWTEENGRNNLLRINGAGAPRAFHIKAMKDVGWFGVNDEAYSRNYGEDYDLVLRMCEKYRIGRVWTAVYRVIRHSGGTDHNIDQVTIDRNDNAKDEMRLMAIQRRQVLNAAACKSSGCGRGKK